MERIVFERIVEGPDGEPLAVIRRNGVPFNITHKGIVMHLRKNPFSHGLQQANAALSVVERQRVVV